MVSIIIPYYNKGYSINNTLLSVNRSYANAINHNNGSHEIEIIIIDDGSDEVNHSYLQEVVMQYDTLPIYVHKKENGGVSSARNMGIELASNDFVYFLDADDFIDYDFFNILSFYKKTVGSLFFNLRINKKILKHSFSGRVFFNDLMFLDLLEKKCIHLSNVLFNFKNGKRYFNNNISVGEDILFVYDALKENHVSFVDDELATYMYDGKFHSSEINGLDIVLKKTQELRLINSITRITNEKKYLNNMFYKKKNKINYGCLSLKVLILGQFRCVWLYMIMQKIRFSCK